MVALVLSSLGGIVALLGVIGIGVKGIFKQVEATKDNTQAIANLSKDVKELLGRMYSLETRVTVLEDRGGR